MGLDEAMRAFDRALAITPDSEEALSNRGCLQLPLGDCANGWEGYEYRWAAGQRPDPASSAQFDLANPASVIGRKIQVVNDHGLGDTIQFFRYVALLAQAGARVTFAGPAKMRRLLSSSGVSIDGRDESDLSGDFDAILAISILPRAFSARLDAMPAGAPFDPRRSIPPAALLPLASLRDARLFSLHKGAAASKLPGSLTERVQTLGEDFDAGPDAFIDTAALMAGLDLIVTCDTSIAQLAGALGRPVWPALRHVSEWRWMADRRDLLWYPTMRLFRCGEGDDWSALM